MKRLLFVDDEPDVLASLKRALREAPPEWETVYVRSGQAALEEMVKAPFDLLVCDLKMPGVNGEDLLAIARKKYPRTIRVVLTSPSDREAVLRLAGPAHQQLSKTCDAKVLCDTVERAFALHGLIGNESLKSVVTQIQSLPSMPSLYVDMLRELRQPEPSIVKLGHIISQDMGMCTKMLQLVNSAFFGLSQQISNPVEAIVYLGVDMVKNIVVSLQLFSVFDGVSVRNFSFEKLWNHCWLTGVMAKRIAQAENMGAQADYAFISGLLHDVGKLVLATGLPTQYQAIVDFHQLHSKSLAQSEQEFLGSTHAEIGAYLLGLWGLPAAVVEAVAFHHRPGDAPRKGFSLVSVLHVANALEHEREVVLDGIPRAQVDLDYLTELGLSERLEFWRESMAFCPMDQAV